MSTTNFGAIPAEHLHYIYGVNCYQHAIGFKYPIIAYKHLDASNIYLDYCALHPGNLRPTIKSGTVEEFKVQTIEGCKEDELEDCGDQFFQKPGYRTLALFFSDPAKEAGNDFHFAFMNSRQLWEAKTPFKDAVTTPDINVISDGYKFDRYLLAPEKVVPKMVMSWMPKDFEIASAQGGMITLKEVSTDVSMYTHSVILRLSENMAVRIKNDNNNKIFPLPAWPENNYAQLRDDVPLRQELVYVSAARQPVMS